MIQPLEDQNFLNFLNKGIDFYIQEDKSLEERKNKVIVRSSTKIAFSAKKIAVLGVMLLLGGNLITIFNSKTLVKRNIANTCKEDFSSVEADIEDITEDAQDLQLKVRKIIFNLNNGNK